MPRLVPPLPLQHGRAPDDIDYAHRDFVNLAAAALLLVVAVLITWTLAAFNENERKQRCFESGRKDCVTIAAPPGGLRIPAH